MSIRVAIAPIRRHGGGMSHTDQDLVAVEAPLAVELTQADGAERRSLGILMRTPGDDRDLVLGLLYTEGIVQSASDVAALRAHAADGSTTADDAHDAVEVVLQPHVDLARVMAGRTGVATSACGLCGRLALRRLDGVSRRMASKRLTLTAATILRLPAALRGGQAVFAETGGLHAAALVTAAGDVVAVREDVGRHNAVDKLVGAALDACALPASDAILAVSGRVAFEIVQKAVMAGVAAIVAVGAPSSLAVEAARATGLTLIGFARDGRFNVYAGAEHVAR